jgi:hypothetical protein
LAKEAEEAKARLKNLGGERKQERASSGLGRDVRKRQLGDIAAILGGGSSKRQQREQESLKDEKQHGRQDSLGVKDEVRQRRRSREDHNEGKDSRRHRSDRRRSRSRSPRDGERRRRHRSRSPYEHRSSRSHRSTQHTSSSSRPPHRSRSTIEDGSSNKADTSNGPDPYDSDPLDSIIGPAPPPQIRSRGRGTISSASGIDSRFSSNYDPSIDVALNVDEEDDWEQALEALRDRTKWKAAGADRLRAAGFTEEEVAKWEKGGNKKEEDVRWRGKGEGREWDRGKVLGEDDVEIDVGWGRLKGT